VVAVVEAGAGALAGAVETGGTAVGAPEDETGADAQGGRMAGTE
jgi:hypothetical protein